MKKRLLKKTNIKKTNKILKELENSLGVKCINIKYGNGYFVFYRGEGTVTHFKLNLLPEWKFGIWLSDKNTYSLFGEPILLIDKFKPSRCSFSFEIKNDLDKLNLIKEFKNVLKDGYGNEDRKESVIYNKEVKKMEDSLNYENLKYIKDKIKELNNRKNINIFYKLKDNNTKNFKMSPRYDIELYSTSKNDVLNDEIISKDFFDICKEYPFDDEKNEESENYYSVDSFIFNYYNIEVINETSFNYRKKTYNWDENKEYKNMILDRK